MSYLGNSPGSELVLRLEARKSFALGVRILDEHRRVLDISEASLHLVVKKLPLNPADTTDADNLIANSTAHLIDPEQGYARFELQASDLDWRPDEYPFALVMISEGYSSVIARGTVDLRPNTEFASISETYSDENPATALSIALRGRQVIEVRTGPVLAPGTTSFTDDDKAKLDSIEEGAQRNIVVTIDGALVTLDDIPDTDTRFALTPEEREKLAELDDLVLEWDNIEHKPPFGTAAEADAEDFLPATGIDAAATTTGVFDPARIPTLSETPSFSSGTGVPTGGNDGDLYFQYS